MVNHSIWNRVDLHIHSKMSSEVKNNDYEESKYSAKELLDKLLEKNLCVNIFSITDHNCLNEELYNELADIINQEQYKEKINYILGVELDIFDTNIYSDVFHCLCFFDCKDVNKVKKSIDSVFDNKDLKERNKKSNYPNIVKIFKCFSDNGIKDIILIPHFNNKSKGLPSDIAIENLNYLCFNAYEDSNNISNINKSLKIYLKAGYDNFPFAVFSDCHNIKKYPDIMDEEFIPCYMLGNIQHPFSSVKNAFQEPRLRISLDKIDNVRNRLLPDKYIEKIYLNNKFYDLSPYQNTIIGKFGSGKSLLLQKIKEGSQSLKGHTMYSEFYDQSENFKLYLSGNPNNSIDEILSINTNIKKYEFLQQEDYSFKSYLNLPEATNLLNRINIKYNFIEDKKFDFNIEDITKNFLMVNDIINNNVEINNLNYEKAFTNEEYFSVARSTYETNYRENLLELNNGKTNLDKIKAIKVGNVKVFNSENLKHIDNLIEIINYKIDAINYLENNNFENELEKNINEYNSEYVNNNAKQSKTVFVNNLDKFLEYLDNLRISCNNLNSKFNKNIFDASNIPVITNIYDNYDISSSYLDLGEYKSPIKAILKDSDRRKDLFTSLLSSIYNKSKLSQNKELSEFKSVLSKYCENINSLYKKTNVVYDILNDGESMLKKSAGEKSSLFIKLIFDLIENDLRNDNSIILILDQPESNIDNDNIYKEISNKLRDLKMKYNKFQSIIVTHNANVGITADSENIIIATENIDKNNKKNFTYFSGCIEDNDFVSNVCDILEGGKKAMEQRTIKYGINIIKKVEKNEL